VRLDTLGPDHEDTVAVDDVAWGCGRSRLFYSRRIGIDEDDNPVRILGGARVVGRIGSWDIGALDMQTDASEVSEALASDQSLAGSTNQCR
jgi:hypothetical protein